MIFFVELADILVFADLGIQVVAFLARRVSVAFHPGQVAFDRPFRDLEAFLYLAFLDAVAFVHLASYRPVREACWARAASDCPLVAFLVDAASGLAQEASGLVQEAFGLVQEASGLDLVALVACLADLA